MTLEYYTVFGSDVIIWLQHVEPAFMWSYRAFADRLLIFGLTRGTGEPGKKLEITYSELETLFAENEGYIGLDTHSNVKDILVERILNETSK